MRFQAQIPEPLEDELDELRRKLRLRVNQRADLLRELATLATWVLRNAEQGRQIEAQGADTTDTLIHPEVQRLQQQRERHHDLADSWELTDAEVVRLAEILDRPFQPTPALRRVLDSLRDPAYKAPEVSWDDDVG